MGPMESRLSETRFHEIPLDSSPQGRSSHQGFMIIVLGSRAIYGYRKVSQIASMGKSVIERTVSERLCEGESLLERQRHERENSLNRLIHENGLRATNAIIADALQLLALTIHANADHHDLSLILSHSLECVNRRMQVSQ